MAADQMPRRARSMCARGKQLFNGVTQTCHQNITSHHKNRHMVCNLYTILIIVTSWTVHGAACAQLCPPREVPRRSSGPRLRPRPLRLTEVRMEGTAPYLPRRCSVVVRAFGHCARLPRSVQRPPAREPDHSRQEITGAQRWRCRRPRATRSAGVYEHHPSYSNASRLLCAAVHS